MTLIMAVASKTGWRLAEGDRYERERAPDEGQWHDDWLGNACRFGLQRPL
jgi:hypothetical protein